MGRTITLNGVDAAVYSIVNTRVDTAVSGLASKTETLTNKTLSAPIKKPRHLLDT